MPIAVIATIILILKLAEIGPVARWSWFWVLLPWAMVFVWWEFIAPMIGWEKRAAKKKMEADAKAAEEKKRKERGF